MSQLDPPNRPAKQTRQNVLPWEHAKSTREHNPPNSHARDPPFPASPPPPPPAPPTEKGEGAESRPGPPVHLEQVLLLSLECLHILTEHNIYAFYTERIKQVHKYITLGEGIVARRG
jgi:hypothetical protein